MTVPGEPRKGHTDWVLEGGGESLHVAPAVRKDSTEENALLRGHVSPTLNQHSSKCGFWGRKSKILDLQQAFPDDPYVH